MRGIAARQKFTTYHKVDVEACLLYKKIALYLTVEMIISGFTQKKSFSNLEDVGTNIPGLHTHCMRCRQVSCSQFVDNVTACVMVTCEACGWRCHECKQAEHVLSCPEERVSCVNKEYGCPHVLKRSKVAAHLSVCPASVVCCVEEWCRWPMHAKDKGIRMPLPTKKTYLDCGQLDVGLAMRDQRMLIGSLQAPRKLRHTLRNSLTKKYPAAPLTYHSASFDSDPAASAETSHTVSDDETDAPWDLSKPHPGLMESIRSRLFRVTKETTDSLISALEISSNALSTAPGKLAGISESGDGCRLETEGGNEGAKPVLQRSFSTSSTGNAPSGDFTIDTKTDQQIPSRSSVSAERSIRSLDSGDRSVRTSQSADRSARSSLSSDRFSEASTRSKSTLHDVGGTQLYKLLGFQSEEGQEVHLASMLGVNIGFECINKYVIKNPSIYTFICAQNFRRDEYRWHFKNVHQEIYSGFSGWLEQRCPLAYMGCTFSYHRMEPAQPNRALYHSPLLESFGLRSTVQPLKSSCSHHHGSMSDLENPPHSGKEQGSDHLLSEEGHNKSLINDSDRSELGAASISNLAIVDRAFESNFAYPLPSSSVNDAGSSCKETTIISDVDRHHESNLGKPTALELPAESGDQGLSASDKKYCVQVQPTVYTALNWDSKVLFQYDLEEDDEDQQAEQCAFYPQLISLPFEVLQQIAKHLDSFSLCNLSLTCHLLRDVCCSLLNDHGIVLLNWQRHKHVETGRFTWKIACKQWMFSTSFEPIRSWKFTKNCPNIGEHLKVCPYNKDNVQYCQQPIKVMVDSPDRSFKPTY